MKHDNNTNHQAAPRRHVALALCIAETALFLALGLACLYVAIRGFKGEIGLSVREAFWLGCFTLWGLDMAVRSAVQLAVRWKGLSR